MSNIFKAYDIRGIYPEEINKEVAFKIGFATVKFLQAKSASWRTNKKLNLVVGEDARVASPELRGAVIDAMTKAGANVYYIGQCTTPLFYFSVNKLKSDGGIMATASHNPSQFGGLKIVGPESNPIGGESGLEEIEKISQETLEPAKESGKVEEANLVSAYIDFVVKNSKAGSGLGNLKIVVDAGNGMTPLVLKPLFEKLAIKPIQLYFEIDCSFPNHSPDVSRDEALIDLKKRVVETRADLGIAFDGDGDRIMFVDERGAIIKAEYILGLLFKDKSGFFNKPRAVYDIRISKSVKELIGSGGIKSRPGHSFMKVAMRTNNADLGGELSGHFFFKEMEYVESSVLVMLKILKIILNSGKHLSELIKPFQKYYHSGEINIPIDSRHKGDQIIKILKEKYKDGKIDELDGITVEYWDLLNSFGASWWFNLRLSNTESIARLVVEADTKDLMDQKVKELNEVMKNAPL